MSKPIECTVKEKIILVLVGRLYSGLLQQESGLSQGEERSDSTLNTEKTAGELESMSGGTGSVDEKLLRGDIKVRDSC